MQLRLIVGRTPSPNIASLQVILEDSDGVTTKQLEISDYLLSELNGLLLDITITEGQQQ